MPDSLPTQAAKLAKILLIDDNQLSRDVLRVILRDAGYVHIREAAEAGAGLKMATHFRPDLICLDVQMPGKSGLELLGELKTLLPRVVVLMVSAHNDRQTIEASVKDHADGYVIKPYNAVTVLKAIAACLAKAGAGPVSAPAID